ncbi:Mitochondrial amidoxime reducing component 2 [Nymphon striatum]|nr:Mitochondrial amidoxime reducing component 2 [Nymphon striatum]
MQTEIYITELNIYPVKSLSGISLQASKLDNMGLKYDRRWMIVSPDGKFLSQRKLPHMALVKTSLTNEKLTLSKTGLDDHLVPDVSNEADEMLVELWGDKVKARKVGDVSDQWLSEAIGVECHLVFIPDNEVRQCDLEYAEEGNRTGFADGFPLLLISEASLADLNKRLDNPVEMRRFRPNIVVAGCSAFAEDEWTHFTAGDIEMKGVKLCSRCVMTTVDPEKGKRSGAEPLATLMKYRKQGNKVLFGMNVIHQDRGSLRVGDVIEF